MVKHVVTPKQKKKKKDCHTNPGKWLYRYQSSHREIREQANAGPCRLEASRMRRRMRRMRTIGEGGEMGENEANDEKEEKEEKKEKKEKEEKLLLSHSAYKEVSSVVAQHPKSCEWDVTVPAQRQ
eukprot:GHVU01126210.1.p3 GENE.GHVU01126210.1~~GHVU01126210.1.p3  ORF type:complete len:125 (+),score=33.47 GHVU01126210.1:276-650(+)